MDATPEQETKWAKRAQEWIKKNRRRYCPETTTKVSEAAPKDAMPAEYLRKIVKVKGDMSSKRYQNERSTVARALMYTPHAILKLWENMPMPWEPERHVGVMFHVSGGLTMVTDTPRVIEPVYHAQWGCTWVRMRQEKRDRPHFPRMTLPPFDPDEPPTDYGDVLLDMPTRDGIELGLDEEEERALEKWWKEPIGNGGKDRAWRLPLEAMLVLYRLGRVLCSDYVDPNYFYLFERQSFFTAKALNVAIPGGPKFEPLFRDEDVDDDWNDFNDLAKTILRNPIRTEYQIAFPHLYNSRPRKVAIAPYHSSPLLYMRSQDPDLPAFAFDPVLAPIPPTTSAPPLYDDDDGDSDFILPVGFTPFLSDVPLSNANTSAALDLYWAPAPYCHRSGQMARVIDIPLVQSWFKEHCPQDHPVKVRVSYQKLLKLWVGNELRAKTRGENAKTKERRKNLFAKLADLKFFQTSTIDWLEAGLQLCRQAHNMLNLLLHRRNLVFLNLDYNFALKPVKALTTKERKKSRLGPAFHLVREFMGLTKIVVDVHVKHRIGECDAFQLADALHHIFTHVGKLTGLYRHKYRTMRQVRRCKDLKHLLYYRFNTGPVGKGPGMGFWVPAWRTWVLLLRGLTPLIERYEVNMLAREFEGRRIKGTAQRVTKQRTEAHFDKELKDTIAREVADMLPEGVRANKVGLVLQHYNEAWRMYKAHKPWKVPGLPPPFEALIVRFVRYKADWWTSMAHYNRERIRQGAATDKSIVRKNHGRLIRLKLMAEQDQQHAWVNNGPFVTEADATGMYRVMGMWLADRKFQPIPFPPVNYKHDIKLMRLALDTLKDNHGAATTRSGAASRKEKEKIEEGFDKISETIVAIKRRLMTKRSFNEMTIEYVDYFTHLVPVYEMDPDEKIADMYLAQYLFYEADRRKLFPNWVKPSDDIPNPARVHNWCQAINNLTDVWGTKNGESVCYLETTLDKIAEKIDLQVLNRLLRLIVDKHLADYMTTRNNVSLTYKDMSHINRFGLIRGLQFAPFLFQFWGMTLDLAILGLTRAAQLEGEPNCPNDFMAFADPEVECKHHIRMYMRYLDQVHIVFRFTQAQSTDLVQRYHIQHPERSHESVVGYRTKKCWPRDTRMRLLRQDVTLGRAVFWMVQDRIPRSATTILWEDTYVSVYSCDNPHLLFSMSGFEICMKPRCRMPATTQLSDEQNVWHLTDSASKGVPQVTAQAFLQVTADDVKRFEIRIRLVLMNSGQTPFQKIVDKWNTQITALCVYFREAITGTPDLLKIIVRGETKIQNRIKIQLNSKMPARFPPVVFYAARDIGGLGMLSMGHVLIPQTDMRYARQSDVAIQHFRSGMTHDEGTEIPNLLRYMTMWQDEMRESVRVWREYKEISDGAILESRRVNFEDVADLLTLGIPRVGTNFQSDKQTLLYDKGWRVRQEYKVYNLQKPQPYWWTNKRHDGKLFSLDKYRGDVVQAFGGVEAILQHSIFPCTGFTTWEGLQWDRVGKFEEQMKNKKITNAQRGGLSKIPNKRFTLWWSPTINRSSVYVGFVTTIDLTGVTLHAKLPMLKTAMVETFRQDLWKKIHRAIVADLAKGLEKDVDSKDVDEIEVQPIPPRKSYRSTVGCADIVITASNSWKMSKPSLLAEVRDAFDHTNASKYWIDVQLRWGDYDSHDVERYARSKFCGFTTDNGESPYPCPTGIVVAWDLAYNRYSCYGHWFPGLKALVIDILAKIARHNPELAALRDRVRRTLQVAAAEPMEASLSAQNYDEMFCGKTVWMVDGSGACRAIPHRTFEGNLSNKKINGAVLVFNPMTGQLYLLVLHADVWKGQKRISQLAKLKVAEAVSALVRSLPKEDFPQMIISTQKNHLDTLTNQLSDLTNTVIKGTHLQVPYKALMDISRIDDIVRRAVRSETQVMKLYDDWLDTVRANTAFFRLALILRALLVAGPRARSILRPDATTVTRPHHLWPTLSPEEWIKVEASLKDMIIADYGKKNSVDVTKLTSTELRDILLGQEVQNVNIQKEQMDALDGSTKAAQKAVLTARVVKTVNKLGQEMVVATTSAGDARTFTSKTDWRVRALATASRPARTMVSLQEMDVTARGTVSFVIPENVLHTFVGCADVRAQIIALMYGTATDLVREVRCLVFPPQSGSNTSVTFPLDMPSSNPLLKGLVPIGIMHTHFGQLVQPNPSDLATIYHIATANAELEPIMTTEFVSVSVAIGPGTCVLAAFRATEEGMEFAQSIPTAGQLEDAGDVNATMFERKGLVLATTYKGYYLVPEEGGWNHAFSGTAPSSHTAYGLTAATPHDFYHPSHRTGHFRNFAAAEGMVVARERTAATPDDGVDFDDNMA